MPYDCEPLSTGKKFSTNDIAKFSGININTVSSYVRRCNEGGIESLLRDKTKKLGTELIPETVKNKLVQFVCLNKPEHETHWSTRELGRRFGISHTTVNSILNEYCVKPHLIKKFQFSTDKDFKHKLADVIGFYLNPPENSIVFCVDENSQIQALECTQSILPLRPGIPERQTHDYFRHGILLRNKFCRLF